MHTQVESGRPDVGIVWNEMKVHTLLNTTMYDWCRLCPSFTMLKEIFHKRFPTLFVAVFFLLFCPHVYLYSIIMVRYTHTYTSLTVQATLLVIPFIYTVMLICSSIFFLACKYVLKFLMLKHGFSCYTDTFCLKILQCITSCRLFQTIKLFLSISI